MFRTRTAIAVGRVARVAARLRGGGSAWPGLVAETIDPQLLAHTLADLPGGIVVVSGTNGKTTTTKMLVALLRAHGVRVFTNPTGSNYTRGVISSMLGELPLTGRLAADIAVLELDEAHALKFTEVVRPSHVLLLNVARDQLDRFAEIDATARLLTRLAGQASAGVVLNRDDPFIARIHGTLAPGVAVTTFTIDPQAAADLPSLHEADVRSEPQQPLPPVGDEDGVLLPQDGEQLTIRVAGAVIGPVRLQQRGLAAMINATAATTTARMVLAGRFDPDLTQAALAALRPAFGRGEVIDADGTPLELVLVKNPAGFTVALGTYGATPVPTMIAINDNYADGQDVSWLYDVSFAGLRDEGVAVTSGVRAYDMALRLQYDDVPVGRVEPDLPRALDHFLAQQPGRPRRIFCTYTAMMALRRMLQARYRLAGFGEEAS